MKKQFFYLISALTLMFVGLKLANKINWSWWQVFSPVWIPITILIVLYVWSLMYCTRQYRKNEHFRNIVDKHNEQKRRENMTLADRLREMQHQAEKMKK